nr:hypothetical protein [Paludibacteraceae bacterium]
MGVIKYGCRFLMGLVSLLMLNVGEAYSQCEVGGTDFTTSTALFNPTLKNDSTGWFNKKLGDLLADECNSTCQYFEEGYNVAQVGLLSNELKIVGNTTPSWRTLTQANSYTGAGFVGVTANPRIISPWLSAGSGNNMLVAIGNNHDMDLFYYSLSGLRPNSSVTLTVDVYNLLSLDNLKEQVIANNGRTSSWDGNLSVAKNGTNYVLQQSEANSTTSKGTINGNKASVTVYTDLVNGQPGGKTATTGNSFNWGSSTQIKLTANADPGGNITFHFRRTNGGNDFAPIGFDNIKITGEVQPSITYSGSPCPMMPVVLRPRSTYPAGTIYKWVVDNKTKTGTESTYTFEPQSSDIYSASLTVTLPGCSESKPDKIDIEVGDCCQDDQGNPMALVNLYYNDFGRFQGKQYLYVDANGNEKSVMTTDEMEIDGAGMTAPRVPCIADQLGKSKLAITYGSDVYSGKYAITTNHPKGYGGVSRDNTYGDGTGGMMVMDLKGTGWKNKEIFSTEITGLCRNRKIKFSVAVAPINSAPTTPMGSTMGSVTVELVDKRTGNPIQAPDGRSARYDHVFYGNEPWKLDSLSFVSAVDLDAVILRVISTEDDYDADHRGDFAIDDITFQVCAPPDINVDYELTGNAPDLLNLCTGDTLTLDAIVSSAASKYYGTPYYLFQYTYENPEEASDPEKIKWYDMVDPETQTQYLPIPKFVVKDPASDPAFEKIQLGQEADVYFRVVVTDKSTMDMHEKSKTDRTIEDPMAVSPISPCRNVSVSTMIIKASLNCAKCHQSEDIKMKGDASGLTNTRVEKENGYDVYSLCYGESLTLSSADVTTKINDDGRGEKPYADYLIDWYRDQQTTPESGYTVASGSKAKDYTITNDNSGTTAKEVFLYVKTSDNFDVTAKHCQRWDTVKVILNPKPVAPTIDDIDLCEKVKPRTELKDRLAQSDFSGYKVNWYDASGIASSEPDLDAVTATTTYTYSVTDKTTLCEGDTKSFEVEVHSTSNPLGNMKVSYLVKDTTSSGVFKDLVSQDATVLDIESGYTYEWFDENNHSLGNSVPVPDVPSLPLTEDVQVTYYVARKDNQYGCWSDTMPVVVTIFGVPAPNPEDVYYCVGSSRVVPLTAQINTTGASANTTFELVWYNPNKTLIGASAPTPSVATEGETIYYVSQKSSDGAESSLQPLSVKVYKAHALSPVAEDVYCDDEQNPRALVQFAEDGTTDYDKATDIHWYLYGDAWDTDKLPVLDIKKDTTYVFGAVQSYKVTSALGAELETCYSDTTYYTVKSVYTPPTGDSSVAYIAAEVGADNKTFPSIDTKEGWSEEPGYTYYYSEAGANNFS